MKTLSKIYQHCKAFGDTWTRAEKLVMIIFTLYLLGIGLYSMYRWEQAEKRAEYWRWQAEARQLERDFSEQQQWEIWKQQQQIKK
jgi:hypothetical protein